MPRANSRKDKKRKRPPLPTNGIASRTQRLPIDVTASSTRHQKNDIAAAWDIPIPIPIIIEIISWIDQESLINLSLVSKQMHDIIRNEPGNKNKISSVFEVRGSSTLKLFKNLQGYFLNEKTKKRLQSYHIMTCKDLYNFDYDTDYDTDYSRLFRMVRKCDVQMNGITSLNYSSPSPTLSGLYCSSFRLLAIIMKILPNLRKVDLSGTIVNNRFLHELSHHCPLLENVVISRNPSSDGIDLSRLAMSDSRYLKEIHMNNVKFCIRFREAKNMSDLDNHREIFIFHHCCKALERVSILNMELEHHEVHLFLQPDHEKSTFIQNILIKFVRNVPSLRWFRSDLTSENMTMLRMERPEIEFLN